MVTGKAAHVDDFAGHTMSSSAQSSLSALLDKADDKDPICRKASMEAMRELMQREVLMHDEKSMNNFMCPFIDTLLGTLDKKSKHQILVEQSPYSQLAHSSAFLLAEVAHHATHQHLRLSLHHITSIVKHLVSWFPLDMGPASHSHSLHQACAKLVCSLAENAALHDHFDDDDVAKSSSSTCSSPSFTHSITFSDTSDLNDNSSTSSSCNNTKDMNPHPQQCALGMESLCRPLMAALCSKVEPISRGATICLEALVSMESWFASPSLIEELCLRAVNVMQERSILSTSIAQMSLLSILAKKNRESLSYFRAGLLKKGADILLSNGAWQQRVAAARMIECLLSMGSHESMGSKLDKQAVMQAMEALENCKLDKVAMVRSAVMEALRKAKLQPGPDRGRIATSTPEVASTSSCSTMKSASKVDYRKRRRKKPPCGPYEKQPTFSSPSSIRSDPFSGNDRWTNKVTPFSGWSSSDSVDSFVDSNCPRKKVAKTTKAYDGKTGALRQKIGQWNVNSVSSSSTFSPSISSSSVVTVPLSASSSCNLRSSMEETTPTYLDSVSTEAKLSNKLDEKCGSEEEDDDVHTTHNVDHTTNEHSCGAEGKCNSSGTLTYIHHNPIDLFTSCSEEEVDFLITHNDKVDNTMNKHAYGTEGNCSSCASPTYIHHNPIAQLESLEEVESLEVSKSDVPSTTTSVSLLLPTLKHTKLQSMGVTEGMKRIELINDMAWNVRNNPIATDDSELDSPRPTVFDSCSIVYCADGDDEDEELNKQGRRLEDEDDKHQEDDEVKLQRRRPDVIDVHSKEHLQEHLQEDDKFVSEWQHGHVESDMLVNKGQHGHVEEVGGDDGFVDCSPSHSFARKGQQGCAINDGSKQDLIHALRYCIVDDKRRDDSYDGKGDMEVTEKQGSLLACSLLEGNSANQLHTQEDLKVMSMENNEGSTVVPKDMLMECRAIEEQDNIAWHDVNACISDPKRHCCPCQQCLLQDNSAEKCTLKEREGYCTPGSSISPTEDGGFDHNAIANLGNQLSTHREQRPFHANDPHPLVAIHEHEGIGDNLSTLTHSHNSALHNTPELEPSRCECSSPSGHQLKGGTTHEEDSGVLGSAKDMEALQACSMQKRSEHGQEDECRGNAEEESGNSVVGWLRECYVVKKLGTLGTLFLAITIPLAVVSFVNTFDTKEEASDFLVPT